MLISGAVLAESARLRAAAGPRFSRLVMSFRRPRSVVRGERGLAGRVARPVVDDDHLADLGLLQRRRDGARNRRLGVVGGDDDAYWAVNRWHEALSRV